MPEYVYKVQNLSGKTEKGKMNAKDEAALIDLLKGKGLYPIEIRQTSALNKDINFAVLKRVTLRDLSVFCRQFSTVISAGITVMGSLDIMRQQTENVKLKQIVNHAFEEVQKGRSLSSVMREHKEFPPLFINMVEAGEASGQLELVLERMAVYYEKEYKLRKKIKSALTYPIAIMIVAMGVVTFLVAKIVPMFAGMITQGGGELPLPTRILLGISSGFSKYGLIIFGVIALLVYFIIKYTSAGEGQYQYHRVLLNSPIFGKINKKIVTSRFSSTLSLLLESGIPVIQAMDIVEKTVTNAVVERGISKCKDEINRGSGLSRPIAGIGVFPPMLIEMISIGEESGQVDEMLEKTSEFYDQEVELAVASLTTLIEPVIIVVLGGIVAFIVISILMPMFDMYNYVAM